MTLVKIHDELYIPDNFAEDHSYYADSEGKKPYTGITTVLGVIGKPALVSWAAKMVVEYIKDNGIFNDTEETYEITIKQLEEAKNAHRKKKEAAGESGTDLHALAEGYVRLSIQEYDGKPMDTCPTGLEQFRDWAKQENITFLEPEKKMYSKTWWIAGTADLIFEKDGKKYIGDIKTYAKIWDRVPFFQCAGYANMYEEMTEGKETIAGYCIIRISKDGTFETKWSFDTVGDTRAFFACVELYRQLQNYQLTK